MGVPGMYCAVWSLKALQKFMRFRPRCPSAEPTGGCGVAFPAGTVSRKREASRPAMFPRGRGARLPPRGGGRELNFSWAERAALRCGPGEEEASVIAERGAPPAARVRRRLSARTAVWQVGEDGAPRPREGHI